MTAFDQALDLHRRGSLDEAAALYESAIQAEPGNDNARANLGGVYMEKGLLPEAVAEFQAVISSGDIIASGLPPVSDGDDDDIPVAGQRMASRAAAKGTNTGGANEKYMQTLQEMQDKVRNAQNRLASGKGGFSRA